MSDLFVKLHGEEEATPIETNGDSELASLWRYIIHAARLKREIAGRVNQLEVSTQSITKIMEKRGFKYVRVNGNGMIYTSESTPTKFDKTKMQEYLITHGVDMQLVMEAVAEATTKGETQKRSTFKAFDVPLQDGFSTTESPS